MTLKCSICLDDTTNKNLICDECKEVLTAKPVKYKFLNFDYSLFRKLNEELIKLFEDKKCKFEMFNNQEDKSVVYINIDFCNSLTNWELKEVFKIFHLNHLKIT